MYLFQRRYVQVTRVESCGRTAVELSAESRDRMITKNISLDRTQRSCTISNSLISGTLILEAKLTESEFALRWFVQPPNESFRLEFLSRNASAVVQMNSTSSLCLVQQLITNSSRERTYSQGKGNEKKYFGWEEKPRFPRYQIAAWKWQQFLIAWIRSAYVSLYILYCTFIRRAWQRTLRVLEGRTKVEAVGHKLRSFDFPDFYVTLSSMLHLCQWFPNCLKITMLLIYQNFFYDQSSSYRLFTIKGVPLKTLIYRTAELGKM